MKYPCRHGAHLFCSMCLTEEQEANNPDSLPNLAKRVAELEFQAKEHRHEGGNDRPYLPHYAKRSTVQGHDLAAGVKSIKDNDR